MARGHAVEALFFLPTPAGLPQVAELLSYLRTGARRERLVTDSVQSVITSKLTHSYVLAQVAELLSYVPLSMTVEGVVATCEHLRSLITSTHPHETAQVAELLSYLPLGMDVEGLVTSVLMPQHPQDRAAARGRGNPVGADSHAGAASGAGSGAEGHAWQRKCEPTDGVNSGLRGASLLDLADALRTNVVQGLPLQGGEAGRAIGGIGGDQLVVRRGRSPPGRSALAAEDSSDAASSIMSSL